MKRLPARFEQCAVGDRVRLIQQIPRGTGCIISTIVGRVVDIGKEATGAWYAHGRDGHFWVDRITIAQDDGAVSDCVLDAYSHVERIVDSACAGCRSLSGGHQVSEDRTRVNGQPGSWHVVSAEQVNAALLHQGAGVSSASAFSIRPAWLWVNV